MFRRAKRVPVSVDDLFKKIRDDKYLDKKGEDSSIDKLLEWLSNLDQNLLVNILSKKFTKFGREDKCGLEMLMKIAEENPGKIKTITDIVSKLPEEGIKIKITKVRYEKLFKNLKIEQDLQRYCALLIQLEQRTQDEILKPFVDKYMQQLGAGMAVSDITFARILPELYKNASLAKVKHILMDISNQYNITDETLNPKYELPRVSPPVVDLGDIDEVDKENKIEVKNILATQEIKVENKGNVDEKEKDLSEIILNDFASVFKVLSGGVLTEREKTTKKEAFFNLLKQVKDVNNVIQKILETQYTTNQLLIVYGERSNVEGIARAVVSPGSNTVNQTKSGLAILLQNIDQFYADLPKLFKQLDGKIKISPEDLMKFLNHTDLLVKKSNLATWIPKLEKIISEPNLTSQLLSRLKLDSIDEKSVVDENLSFLMNSYCKKLFSNHVPPSKLHDLTNAVDNQQWDNLHLSLDANVRGKILRDEEAKYLALLHNAN